MTLLRSLLVAVLGQAVELRSHLAQVTAVRVHVIR